MIKIRKATRKDIQKLLNLWQGLMDYHKRLDRKAFALKNNSKNLMKSFFIKNIKNKNSIVLIAEDKEKAVGYLMGFIQRQPPIYIDDKYGYLSDAFIVEEYRKKGIMKEMVNQAEAFFKTRKLKTLSGRVFIGNKKGLEGWKKMGFKAGAVGIFRKIK